MRVRNLVPVLFVFSTVSCTNTISTPIEFGDLTGTWRLVQNDFKKIDSNGRISDSKKSGERYISLRQVGSRVSGKLDAASSAYCTDALIDGEALGSDLSLTVTFTGKCCQGGKIQLVGNVDKSSSPFTFKGMKSPVSTLPPKNCEFHWREFVGFKEV